MRLFAILMCMAAYMGHAQSETIPAKAITQSTMVAFGHTDILDTYISQEKYRGSELRIISHTATSRGSSSWSRLIIHQGYVAWADNRSGNGGEMEGMYNFQYGYMYNWTLCWRRLHIAAGATIDANVGVLYNTHGGNNPAQARCKVALSPTASAAYFFSVGKIPVAISYEAGIPLMGMMFSPNYGQSYYEIFNRGNYDHNIVPVTPFNAPSLRQIFAIDATLGHTTLRIGYLGDIQQSKANHLKQHAYTNSVMIGITRKFSISNL